MFDILINPKGGKGESLKALKVVEESLKAANQPYNVHFTEYSGHATVLAKELNRTVKDLNLIVMGGDGTFHEVLNGIEDFSTLTMGIIPCGSGNDFVKASCHPTDYQAAVDVILKNTPSYVDFIQVGDQRSLNVAGSGMDVDVLLKYASVKKLKGSAAYTYSLLYTLLHTRFHKMQLTMDDGDTMEREVFMIGIGNGRCIGGGMPVCPHAEIDDGKLDIVIINKINKGKIVPMLLKFLKGRHTEMAFTEEFRAEKCCIKVLDDSRFEFDGEVQSENLKDLDIRCVHDTLRMFR